MKHFLSLDSQHCLAAWQKALFLKIDELRVYALMDLAQPIQLLALTDWLIFWKISFLIVSQISLAPLPRLLDEHQIYWYCDDF